MNDAQNTRRTKAAGFRLRRKTIAIIVGTSLALVGAGGALAYWTNLGSGEGTAETGTNEAIVINQTSTPTAMAPGVAVQSLNGTFYNPNSGPVYVAAVTATVTGTDTLGCTASDYTIAGTATVAAQVPAGTGVGTWTGLTIQFNNKAGVNQDACKGAVVTIAYASS